MAIAEEPENRSTKMTYTLVINEGINEI